MLSLPDRLRNELKDPIGEIYTDPETVIAEAGSPLVTVGDIVTTHICTVSVPQIAVIDGKTKRSSLASDKAVDRSRFERELRVENPAATLSTELLEALSDSFSGGSTVIVVDGEEDLVTVPAIVASPTGASVIYGQPNEGMVLVSVDEAMQARMRELLSRMDGDHTAALTILG